MIILGISAFYHDSAAAIIQDGIVVAAAQEERFTRKKNDPSFPTNAVRFCLQYAGVCVDELAAVVFYDKPFLKFERLLETYYAFAPNGFPSFVNAMPVWLKEKLFLKKIIYDRLNSIEKVDGRKLKLLFPEHHLSHASGVFFASPFKKAAILTIDGVGEWATASISLGEDNRITTLRQLEFPHSLGLLYSAFTYFCGFKVNSGEYKLMGLAPYGHTDTALVNKYINIIKSNLIDVKQDGSIFIHQQYFNYATGLTMINEEKWKQLFGIPKRKPESELNQSYCCIALAIQTITEEIVLKLGIEAKRLTGADNLCMSGGVALNCVANGKLDQAQIFEKIYVQSAAGDAGAALGAAYAAHFIYFGKEREIDGSLLDAMKGSYLGPEYFDKDVLSVTKKYSAVYEYIEEEDILLDKVADLISTGQIIGWHQGRMEFGPRALGARSIIADARDPEMQSKLNLKIKFRENFRPFAPAVLAEDAHEYFEHTGASPYMLFVKPVVKRRQIKVLSSNERDKDFWSVLHFARSDIPSVTHVDYSARFQTVHKETNFRFWKLLQAFKSRTGCSVIINTSFNVRGEPIVNTPEQAYRCFMRTEMDYLVINNFLFYKNLQPKWNDTAERKNDLTTD